MSTKYSHRQDLFFLQVTHSSFSLARKGGKGGALLISSDVERSKVTFSSLTFMENKVCKISESNPGKGGAVFVEGISLFLAVEDSVFSDNSADNRGSALYAAQGVTLSIENTSFTLDIDAVIFSPVVSSLGEVTILAAQINFNIKPLDVYTGGFKVFTFEEILDSVKLSVVCPPWHQHIVEYELGSLDGDYTLKNYSILPLNNVIYTCAVCNEDFYTTSNQKNILSYPAYNSSTLSVNQVSESNLRCIKCPYGASCSGNDVKPKDNYWGYWHEKKPVFQQCPAGYCCSGSNRGLCVSYDSCAQNRTGILCGACQYGFSVSILSGQCTADSNCGEDQWFWLLAVLGTLAYALWYTFKDDIIALFFYIMGQFQICCSFKESKANTVPLGIIPSISEPPQNNQNKSTHSGPPYLDEDGALAAADITFDVPVGDLDASLEQDKEDGVDKGYFGIITYFVQMAAVMKVQIEFSDIDKSESFLDSVVDTIARLLSIELSQVSLDLCPVVGLTTLGKHLYKLIFLFGIYASWSALFILILISISLVQQKAENTLMRLHSFKIKLIRGITEIIKYTYAGFCSGIFVSLVCAKVGTSYVWWYDGTNVCLGKWQYAMIAFGTLYAIPFPVVLFIGMRRLKLGEISASTFVVCCLCPLFALTYFIPRRKFRCSSATNRTATSDAGKVIISVLQGPYRETSNMMTVNWEAMVSIRRLLITGMTLVSFASIRMVTITILCIAFLCHHIHLYPFRVKTSNVVETLSLSLLTITSVTNLLKASLTDSGVIPTGPSVPFFKTLELCEKIFVLILIGSIIVIEVKPKFRKNSSARNVSKSEA